MNPRFRAMLVLLLLGATACGDAAITATSRFPRDGDDANRGAIVRVEAQHSTGSEPDQAIE